MNEDFVIKMVDKIENFICLEVADSPEDYENIMDQIVNELEKRYKK